MTHRWRLRNILALPAAYRFFQDVVMNQRNLRQTIANDYVKHSPRLRILDIGCGPGDIIECFGDVDYVGFDSNESYIKFAKKRFGHKGKFFCAPVEKDTVREHEAFDVVLASQVIHHLSDKEARDLLELAYTLLKPGGRLISIDPCYVKEQSPIARFLISKDRGEFVRNQESYFALVKEYFSAVTAEVRHDVLRLPYTFLAMQCVKANR
jgi:SAM-dependent methyltransferase